MTEQRMRIYTRMTQHLSNSHGQFRFVLDILVCMNLHHVLPNVIILSVQRNTIIPPTPVSYLSIPSEPLG